MFAKRKQDTWKVFTGFLVLAAYLFVFLFARVSHNLTHEHKPDSQVLHNEQAEQDNCHRALYHASPNDGCVHKGHFISKEDICELCVVILQSSQVIAEYASFTNPSFGTFQKENLPSEPFRESLYRSSSPRAPPVL